MYYRIVYVTRILNFRSAPMYKHTYLAWVFTVDHVAR